MAKIIPAKNGTKKEAITRKAAHLFKEKGFMATSMRDLAIAVGVEAPSLYNYITGKSELLQEICFKIANIFNNNLEKIENQKANALSKIEKIIRFHIRMMLEDHENVFVSDHEWKHLPEPYQSNFRNQRSNYRRRLSNIFLNGMEKKELKQMDPYVGVYTMLASIGAIESWHRSKKPLDPQMLEDKMTNILIDGLRRS